MENIDLNNSSKIKTKEIEEEKKITLQLSMNNDKIV